MGLVERASSIGSNILNYLGDVLKGSASVVDIRGRGAAVAVEFRDDPVRHRTGGQVVLDVVQALLGRGILALNSGFPKGNVLLLCPPLTISDSQLERAVEELKEAIHDVTGDPA